MRNLSSVFGKKSYNLQEEIRLLYSQLEDIEKIKEMVAGDGWEIIKSGMMRIVSGYDVSIQELSNDPEKNKTAITGKIAMRSALMGLIGCVDRLLGSNALIEEQLKKLNEIAEKAGLSEITS